MTGYVSIGYGDLAFAAILLVVNAGLSLWLGLERQMLIAAARMTVLLAVFGGIRLLTDDRDRLRLDRLRAG